MKTKLIATFTLAASIASISFAAGQHAQGRYQPSEPQTSSSISENASQGIRQYSQTVQHQKATSGSIARTAEVQTAEMGGKQPTKVHRQHSEAVQHHKGVKTHHDKMDDMMAANPATPPFIDATELLNQIDALFGDFSKSI